MQYIDYLTKQPSDKDAIIINGDRYTYGKLYVLVQDARARLPQVAEKTSVSDSGDRNPETVDLISGVCGNKSGTSYRAGGQQT